MLTEQELKDTILFLRSSGHTIGSIHVLTGVNVTAICEVIYEQNQIDIHNDGGTVIHINTSIQ
jgi:hypothetical protein